MATLSRKTFTYGKFKGQAVSGRHFTATVIGGPELARKLAELERTIQIEATRAGVEEMGRVLGNEWANRVPILEHHYQESINTKGVRVSKRGASGIVGPTKIGVPDDEQPMAYSAVLEFGDRTRPAEPSARPAYDAKADAAVEAAVSVMREIVLRVCR